MNDWKVIRMRRLVYLAPVLLGAMVALILGATAHEQRAQDDGDDGCSSTGGPGEILPATKLFIEHNATDADTGVHGPFTWVLSPYVRRSRAVLGHVADRSRSVS